MKFLTNEIKVGLTVLGALAVSIFGYSFMRDIPLFNDRLEVYSVFPRAAGLTKGALVYVNGVSVGSIKSIELNNDYRVRVVMSLELGIEIPEDSRAEIVSPNPLAGSAVAIRRGLSGQIITDGGEIQSGIDDDFTELMVMVQEMGGKINDLTTKFSDRFDSLSAGINLREAAEDVGSTIGNVKETTKDFSELLKARKTEIDQTILYLKSISENTADISEDAKPKIDSLLISLNKRSEEFGKLGDQVSTTLDEMNLMLGKINRGEGTIGLMVNDPSLYQNLDSLTYNLQRVVKHLDEDPKRFLKHVKIKLF